ncbi:tetratricopeptide repeat protein [Glaciecola petra]|uniref:Tetratricopeptide repeat protein n=1 Tax=Glaciecola petra TaxID=3075602 RepID=A0ABU2ZLC0_9ALTE|nr:tetratricopeptide repeat protein [Aestuariibacter sp. P117]MDT0593430.1 tetratricopeptide repeat protein [Aestuariibacter sp. P117]
MHEPIVFHSEHFPEYQQTLVESPEQIFALDENAIHFVKQLSTHGKTNREKAQALVDGIFGRTQLAMDYSANANTTATQTFHQGISNCLSLTIMTYAMAEKMGLDSRFQKIMIPEYWTRRDGNTILNGHVNLRVKKSNSNLIINSNSDTIIDFQPLETRQSFPVQALSKSEVVSLFYVNKGAELMMNKRLSQAYAYFKAALNSNEYSTEAWLNLGVLYVKKGLYHQAQEAYLKALSIKPSYNSAKENMAKLYKRLGQYNKAKSMLLRLANERESNPYYQSMKAEIALENGQYDKAVTYFKKAIKLKKKNSEFYFGLARAHWAMGDTKRTKQSLQKAIRHSQNISQTELYATKHALLSASP